MALAKMRATLAATGISGRREERTNDPLLRGDCR
jgi:hypothetical protein